MTSAGRFLAAGKVAIAGFAHSPVTRVEQMPLGVLTIETIKGAVADAGVTLDMIDGFSTASALVSSSGRDVVDGIHTVSSDWVVSQLGLEPRWVVGFQGIGQVSASFMLAVEAIASGAVDYAVVHRAMHNPSGSYHANPMVEAHGSAQWEAPQGMWGPPTYMALPYMEYLQRYGARREDLAEIVVAQREAGAAYPWSYWKDKPITVDDYMSARMIADPMSILDCDIPINGVAAFVLTTAERVRDLPNNPVYVRGSAMGTRRSSNMLADFAMDNIIAGGKHTASKLWQSSGLRPDEVDVPQIYDGFSPVLWFWLEALGYAPDGQGYQFAKDPVATAGMTFRTGGGSIGTGRMHGVPQLLETYLQLSRRAGERQLDRADVGIACHGLPHAGAAIALTAEPN